MPMRSSSSSIVVDLVAVIVNLHTLPTIWMRWVVWVSDAIVVLGGMSIYGVEYVSSYKMEITSGFGRRHWRVSIQQNYVMSGQKSSAVRLQAQRSEV